jgi:Protein of unknown function (DUF1264)
VPDQHVLSDQAQILGRLGRRPVGFGDTRVDDIQRAEVLDGAGWPEGRSAHGGQHVLVAVGHPLNQDDGGVVGRPLILVLQDRVVEPPECLVRADPGVAVPNHVVGEPERFRSLPEDEKRLWHSHHYEVKSGILAAPGIPDLAEHAYFRDLVTTYGKTFHTWQYDRDDFPYGIPQLMMGLTEDGQANEALICARDHRLGISTAHKRQNRADIASPSVLPGANSWESGQTVQTRLEEMDFKR